MSIKAGDKFKSEYPFKLYNIALIDGSVDVFWAMGCHITTEDDGSSYGHSTNYSCDGIGEIELEVLAVVDMPRKYQQRIIYKFKSTDPVGVVKSRSKDYTVTLSRFNQLIDRPYRAEWECS